MKKLFLSVCLLLFAAGSFATEVKEIKSEVLKVFTNTYPGAKNIAWSELKAGYLVYFVCGDASYRITYDLDGNVVVAYKYYGEENLSPVLINKVKKSYPDFKIHSVIERSTENDVEYHIILQSTKKLVTLKSDSTGNFEVESKYNTQSEQ